MKYLTWLVLLGVLLLYLVVVAIFSFPGVVAMAIHFTRITVTIAALLIYIRMAPTMFHQVPPPRRDYLFAAINFFLLSATCFSVWNEAGRVFYVDPSIFTSAVAGLFSLFLVIAASFAIVAPDIGGLKPKLIALGIGAILSVVLVFIAPFFRPS